MGEIILKCKNVIAADDKVKLVYSQTPFSFVGGVDIQSGDIADYRHPNYKENLKGKAFAFPFGRGSSGAGLVLMEMFRLGTAPAAIINIHTDPVILTGPLILKHFYDHLLPVINLTEGEYEKLKGADSVKIHRAKEEMVAIFL